MAAPPRAVLPHLPRRFPTREHAYTTLRRVADLRNQVFHHRPIWRLPLNALHVLATDALGWVSPDLRDLTASLDRFPRVVAAGVGSYERHVEAFVASRASPAG